MASKINTKLPLIAGAAGVAAVVGIGGWMSWQGVHRGHKASVKQVYTSQGYGGIVAVPDGNPLHTASGRPAKAVHADPVEPVRAAYNAGHYAQASAAATQIIARANVSHDPTVRKDAAFARQLLAYSAARQHDMKTAQAQFAALRIEAAKLPDRGRQGGDPRETPPTLEAEAAFQHAVCTAALGHKSDAAAEYTSFMTHYSDSPLIYAAYKRLQKLHGGDATPEEDAVWNKVAQAARQRAQKQLREASVCGPECLAELLKRNGQTADTVSLAKEMGTNEHGVNVASVVETGRRHGISMEGVVLTQKGLSEQRLPVIALIAPGHFVLVDAVEEQTVTVWDPDANGVGKGAASTLPVSEWTSRWKGIAVTAKSDALVKTARN